MPFYKEIKLGKHRIGQNHPPFIVAEMSGNHHRSLNEALKIVEEAKKIGVHALKVQTYTPDTITMNIPDEDFYISAEGSLWRGQSLYQLYQEAYLPWEWHKPIFDLCKELDLVCFSTPFDETAVDFLEGLDVPCYKIASLEIVDIPLIRKVAKIGKPIFLSTGGATIAEIQNAIKTIREEGCRNVVLLKCTSSYPATPSDANLRTLPHMAQCFGTPVGLSDHTLGTGVAIASVAMGACLIEKHFTLSRQSGGTDDAFSLEPKEFKALVRESNNAWQALGDVCYKPLSSEALTLSHRPSLYFDRNVEAGAILKESDVRSVRPGRGLPPEEITKIVGLRLQKSVKRGMPVSWSDFK